MNLTRIMSNDQPEPEPGLEPSCVENARLLWQTSLESPCVFTMDVQNFVPFVEYKAMFSSETCGADQEVELQVYIRVNCQFPIRFSKLSVQLNNAIYNDYCRVTDGHGISAASDGDFTDKDLYLVPGKTKLYTFTFLPVKDDINSQIEVTSMVLELGSETGRCALLRWMGGGGDALLTPFISPQVIGKPQIKHGEIQWNSVGVRPKTKVLPRTAKVDLDLCHQPPCLLNEFYFLSLTVNNKEDVDISNVRLSFGVKEDSSTNMADQLIQVCLDTPNLGDKTVNRISDIDVGTIPKGGQCTKKLYIKNLHTGTRIVFFKVEYEVSIPSRQGTMTCSCQKEEELSLNTVNPFEVSVKLLSMKFEALDMVQIHEPFLLSPELNCTSPWTIQMSASRLRLATNVCHVDKDVTSQLQGVSLNKSECASECFCLRTINPAPTAVSLGTYAVSWRRKTDEDIPYVDTIFPLPSVDTEFIPLSVDLRLPAFGGVKSLLPLSYILQNRTPYPQELEVAMDTNDCFMFSGNKQFHFRVLPGVPYELKYNLFPLVAGHVNLPKLNFTLIGYPDPIDPVLQKMLPTHIFIKPCGKVLSQGT